MTLQTLGPGVSSDGTHVFKQEHPDDIRSLKQEARALKKVQDIPHTQQLIHYHPQERLLVTKHVPGHHFDEKSKEFRTGTVTYTDEQLEQLLTTALEITDRGVFWEVHTKNLLYDGNTFTPIDYTITDKARFRLTELINTLSLREIPIYEGQQFKYTISAPERPANVKERVYEALRSTGHEQAEKLITHHERYSTEFKNANERILAGEVRRARKHFI